MEASKFKRRTFKNKTNKFKKDKNNSRNNKNNRNNRKNPKNQKNQKNRNNNKKDIPSNKIDSDEQAKIQKQAKLSPSYYDAAAILKQMRFKKGSINSLISQCKHQKLIKMTYALAIKYLQNQKVIRRVCEKLMEKADGEVYNDFLIKVLLADMLYGSKKFRVYRRIGEVKFVLDNWDNIINYHETVKSLKENTKFTQTILRYIRVNLLKTTVNEAIEELQKSNFRQVIYFKDNISFESFKVLALNLEADQFTVDYHFPDVLAFNIEGTKQIQELEMYKQYKIAIQDKASLIPIECMDLKAGLTIFESCAAPGMKTAAIASRTNNKVNLLANDYDKNRFWQMQKMLNKFGVLAEMTNVDFLNINVRDYQNLDVILVDPTCSGSGMVRRLDYEDDDELSEGIKLERVNKLAKMQLDLLQVALQCYPKRLIYCTCSTLEIENEDVINNLLETENAKDYEVIDPFPSWPVRGTASYDFSSKVYRSNPEGMLTAGFFCCVLQRKAECMDLSKEEEAKDGDDTQ